VTIAARIDMAAEHAGFKSTAALARACQVTPPAITALVNGSRPMVELLQKIAAETGVSANWLRAGDPAEAPSWADRKQVALDAVKALPDRDRAWMLREIEHVYADDDVHRTPEQATAELVQLRADRELAATGIQALHRQAVEQLAALQRLARDLGVPLDGSSSGQKMPVAPSARTGSEAQPRQIPTPDEVVAATRRLQRRARDHARAQAQDEAPTQEPAPAGSVSGGSGAHRGAAPHHR
jgi:transcriptional regulator with XRE-family HTH domain